jgi:sugar phosphate isomerase/epimerase
MTAPIALQLYSVREAAAKEYEKTVRKVAEMGYVGIEMASIAGVTTEKAARTFKEVGLTVTSVHGSAPVGEKKNEVLDMMAVLNCHTLVIPYQPKEGFTTRDGIRKICDFLNEAHQVAKSNQISLGYHNHWWEAEYKVDEKPAYQVMLEYLNKEIFFQVDTYWMQVGGLDTVDVVRNLAGRASMLHIKDGPGAKDQPMTAVGDGYMNWKSIFAAAGNIPEWLIVELDSCATDMLVAVEKSYNYLTREKFAYGKR